MNESLADALTSGIGGVLIPLSLQCERKRFRWQLETQGEDTVLGKR